MGLFDFFLGAPAAAATQTEATFFEACDDGDAARVSHFLASADFDPNERDEEGQTGFVRACRSGHRGVVSILLKDARVDPALADADGATGFLEACGVGQAKVCATLLLADPRIDPNATDAFGRTGLMLACRNRRLAIVAALLADRRVDVNSTGDRGVTAFWEAARKGLAKVISLLLAEPRIDRNTRDEYGQTPLMLASTLSDPDTCQLLLSDPKVDVKAVDEDGWTALMFASRNDRPDTVRLLLADGRIPVDTADIHGKSAFILACHHGNDEVVAVFCETQGEEILNQTDNVGDTGLMKACYAGFDSIVDRLLKDDRIDVNVQNTNNNETAFTYACAKSDVAIIKLLLSCPRLDITLRNKDGEMGIDLCNWTAKQVVQKAMADRERKERAQKRNLEQQQQDPPEEPLETPKEQTILSKRIDRKDVEFSESTLIGQGGFGAVYKGVLKKTTKVAIKALFAGHDARAVAMFRNEIGVWGGLTQKNILPLMAFCENPPLMISELVQDGDMRRRLDNLGWPLEKGVEYLKGVATGMAYLHSFDVLHGDLKCANIMVDNDIPKICDFGLAKIREHISASSSHGAPSGQAAGTAGFMAPEYCESGKLKPPVDVFAFAMMCYEVFSQGKYPFVALDRLLIIHWVISGIRPKRPFQATDRMWSLMRACWAQVAKDRPSFAQIMEDMERWTVGGEDSGYSVADARPEPAREQAANDSPPEPRNIAHGPEEPSAKEAPTVSVKVAEIQDPSETDSTLVESNGVAELLKPADSETSVSGPSISS